MVIFEDLRMFEVKKGEVKFDFMWDLCGLFYS